MLRMSRVVGLGFAALCLLALMFTTFVGPLGYAPLPLRIGPANDPVEVVVWYGTEKREWLVDAVARFSATNPTVGGRPVRITLRGMGSGEIAQRVATQQWGNEAPPSVISPASSLWLDVLRDDWGRAGNSTSVLADGADQPVSLVQTPLVLLVWEQRANLIWPNGTADVWGPLHSALVADNWSTLGGNANWGPVKLGMTSPLRSNSGTQALVLMTYGFYQTTGGLSPQQAADPGAQRWISEIVRGVPTFGESSGAFMDELVLKGPSAFDVAVTYENLALGRASTTATTTRLEQAQSRNGQPLRLVYPPTSVISDHPYAALGAPWVSAAQRAGAAEFRRFLLNDEAQQLALEYGFRPVAPAAAARVTQTFARFAPVGFQATLPPTAESPSAPFVRALLDWWQRSIGR